MKLRMFCLLFSLSFINVSRAQFFERLALNLKSYQSIYYYIIQKEERTCIFCPSPFTKPLVDTKVENFFKDNNIHATKTSTTLYPLLMISIKDPVIGYAHDQYFNTVNDYEISFNLFDLINNKLVIVYRCTYSRNKFGADNTDEANAYWADLKDCFDLFLKDWKANH